MILNSIGCPMNTARNAMNVAISSILSVDDITAEYVDRYFVTSAVVKKYMEKLSGFQVWLSVMVPLIRF